MIVALILQATVASVSPPTPVPAPAILPTGDWSTLPELALQRRRLDDAPVADYVRDEVLAGRCDAAVVTATGQSLSVDLAVQVAANGQVRRIVPRAIGCATVEQYATGLASRMTRTPFSPPGADSWFRTTIDFAW